MPGHERDSTFAATSGRDVRSNCPLRRMRQRFHCLYSIGIVRILCVLITVLWMAPDSRIEHATT